jgi:hypothetical protein
MKIIQNCRNLESLFAVAQPPVQLLLHNSQLRASAPSPAELWHRNLCMHCPRMNNADVEASEPVIIRLSILVNKPRVEYRKIPSIPPSG